MFLSLHAYTASSPLQEPSDEDELDLSERSLDRLFTRLQHQRRHLPEDDHDEDIDELVARVAKLSPESRGWLKKVWHKVKPHAHKLAGQALLAAAGR